MSAHPFLRRPDRVPYRYADFRRVGPPLSRKFPTQRRQFSITSGSERIPKPSDLYLEVQAGAVSGSRCSRYARSAALLVVLRKLPCAPLWGIAVTENVTAVAMNPILRTYLPKGCAGSADSIQGRVPICRRCR